jgi:hypothetical protein
MFWLSSNLRPIAEQLQNRHERQEFLASVFGLSSNLETQVEWEVNANAFTMQVLQWIAEKEPQTLDRFIDIAKSDVGIDVAADIESLREPLRQWISDVKTIARIKVTNHFDAQYRRSIGRCIAQWRALGVAEQQAESLANDFKVGEPSTDIVPNPSRPLSIVVAPLGSGKSLAAERMYQQAIQTYLVSTDAPIPIYLNGLPQKTLELIVQESAIWGKVENVGATIIIDALDDQPIYDVLHLIYQARSLIYSRIYPATTVTMFMRPNDTTSKLEEKVILPALSENQILDLVNRFINEPFRYVDKYNLQSMPVSMRQTVEIPMFAILYALELTRRGTASKTKGSLFYQFIASVYERLKNPVAIEPLLEKLAILSIGSKEEFVWCDDVTPSRAAIALLIESGIVLQESKGIRFTLPVLTEWFAARGLVDGSISIDEILNHGRELDFWFEPLHLMLSYSSYDLTFPIFSKLVQQTPLFAARIVRKIDWSIAEGHIPLRASEYKNRALDALAVWIQGLGPIKKLIAPISETGEMDEIEFEISTESKHLYIDIFHQDGCRGGQMYSELPTHPSWCWEWSKELIGHNLKELLKHRRIPHNGTFLEEEEFWVFLCALANRRIPSIHQKSIPIAELETHLFRMVARLDRTFPGSRNSDQALIINNIKFTRQKLNKAHDLIERAKAVGDVEINPPLPTISNEYFGRLHSGRTSHDDSTEFWLARTEVVFSKAVESYKTIVETWFSSISSRMATYAKMPFCLHGLLSSGLGWYMEALPEGSENEVRVREGHARFLTNKEFDRVSEYTKLVKLRPHAAGWISFNTHYSHSLSKVDDTPVTTLVYEWLEADLEHLLDL